MGLDSFTTDSSNRDFHGNQHTGSSYSREELIDIIEKVHIGRDSLMSVRELCRLEGTPSSGVFYGDRKYTDLVEESSLNFDTEKDQYGRDVEKPEICYRTISEAFNCSSSQLKGDLSEMIVKVRLTACGIEAHSVDSDNCRYDVLAVVCGDVYKIQVKTGNYIDDRGVIEFRLRSTQSSQSGIDVKPYTEEEIDIVSVYSSHTDSVYVLDYQMLIGQKNKAIRVDDPEIERGNIDYAENYKLENNIGIFKD